MKPICRRFGAVVLCLALCLGFVSAVPSSAAQTQLEKKQEAVQALNDQIEAIEQQIAQYENDKAQAYEQKILLDEKVSLLAQQISQLEEIIQGYDVKIEEQEAEIAALAEQEAEQYELFCRQTRDMEETGGVSYLSILFSASSFTELLDYAMLISEVMEYHNGVIEALVDTQSQLSTAKAALEDSRAQELQEQERLEQSREELETEAARAQELLDSILADEASAKKLLEQAESEAAAIEKEIEELEKQQSQAAGGGYIWPVSSRYITCPFGPRSIGAGYSTTHSGVDIGRVWYSTEIYAAKSGTVAISGYSSVYGNYVVISHGGGCTTLYGHMSTRKVSAGDTVVQGQLIGITGNTGNSKGPHLHFAIKENGSWVDPLKYLTGYTRGW